MKMKIKRWVEIEITHVEILAPVNYGEEEIPLTFPLRSGDEWKATINIETGQIEGWPAGAPAGNLFLTVKDGGTYRLLGPDGATVAEISEDYVPNRVIPGSYGDTIELEIDANGIVTNWPKRCECDRFFCEE